VERAGHPSEAAGRSDDPLIGRVLDGRYRVGQRVARGGMATVYQATDLRLERTVAVKVMHSGLGDDPEFVARFEREARSAARLSHHNVVAVFDQGEDNGTLFLVMEYVPGRTLRDLIRAEAPMDPGQALAVIEPVLAALAAAHDAGMIHRDVKPENVLIADDGRIKVADFGLARAVNAETQHTATGGVLIGTVSYLSPELVVDGKADARSDVYAAGVLMYEMLTGAKPHQADSPIQIAYKHVHEDIGAPSLRVPGLPAYVDALVARATVRDRDLRPSDARVLLHQVRRVRQALDHGVHDDPELTADLLPGARREDTGELTSAVLLDGVYDQDVEYTTRVPQEPMTATMRSASSAPAVTVPAPPRRPVPPATGHVDLAAEPPRFEHPRRSRRGLYLLIGLLVTALIVAIVGWNLGSHTTTPSVINLNEAAARAKIEKAGLKFAVGQPAYSETIPKGSVISTKPAQGDRISNGGTVTAIISLGPERHNVPDGRGQTLATMQSLLTGATLTVGTVTQRYSDTVTSGLVIGTNPAVSTPLRRGTAVDVILSKGPRPITIPDWTGRLATKADTALTQLGFTVTVQQAYSDTVASGKVISQTPNAGTGFKNDVITLVVSQGPQLFAVPNVRGKDATEARQLLEGQGFVVVVVHNPLYVGADVVVGSDPSAGTMVPKGTTVTLSIV
jgi:beta-lactam-binding protein with PASTA domain/serine/threonine protein kinase